MKFIAYPTEDWSPEIRVAGPDRSWMNETFQRFAYLCLPLVMANRSGWELLNPSRFVATWDGSADPNGVHLECEDFSRLLANSHFGHGIITFSTGYIFRTEQGFNLRASGSPNSFKDGVCALEGLIESDWLPFPFTMNWKITRANHPICFEEGEAFTFISPLPRGNLELFSPEIEPLSSDPKLLAEYEAWLNSRRRFNAARTDWTSDEATEGWQRRYLKGENFDRSKNLEHQTRISLQPFRTHESS